MLYIMEELEEYSPSHLSIYSFEMGINTLKYLDSTIMSLILDFDVSPVTYTIPQDGIKEESKDLSFEYGQVNLTVNGTSKTLDIQ